MISREVEEQLRSERNYFDLTELMIRDEIPLDYISGIILPTKQGLLEEVLKILTDASLNLPIYDLNGNLLAGDPLKDNFQKGF